LFKELIALRKQNDKFSTNLEQLNEELKPKQELVRDLKSLLTTQDHTDCQLTIGGQKYFAHKCIMSARSEVLRKLLAPQNNTNLSDPKNKQKPGPPGQNNTVEMNDIDPEIMPCLLNYLYTGETENGINDRNVPSVMKVADKFDLVGLRNACLGFMENRINRGKF
jgi:speckle-type POZ protein